MLPRDAAKSRSTSPPPPLLAQVLKHPLSIHVLRSIEVEKLKTRQFAASVVCRKLHVVSTSSPSTSSPAVAPHRSPERRRGFPAHQPQRNASFVQKPLSQVLQSSTEDPSRTAQQQHLLRVDSSKRDDRVSVVDAYVKKLREESEAEYRTVAASDSLPSPSNGKRSDGGMDDEIPSDESVPPKSTIFSALGGLSRAQYIAQQFLKHKGASTELGQRAPSSSPLLQTSKDRRDGASSPAASDSPVAASPHRSGSPFGGGGASGANMREFARALGLDVSLTKQETERLAVLPVTQEVAVVRQAAARESMAKLRHLLHDQLRLRSAVGGLSGFNERLEEAMRRASTVSVAAAPVLGQDSPAQRFPSRLPRLGAEPGRGALHPGVDVVLPAPTANSADPLPKVQHNASLLGSTQTARPPLVNVPSTLQSTTSHGAPFSSTPHPLNAPSPIAVTDSASQMSAQQQWVVDVSLRAVLALVMLDTEGFLAVNSPTLAASLHAHHLSSLRVPVGWVSLLSQIFSRWFSSCRCAQEAYGIALPVDAELRSAVVSDFLATALACSDYATSASGPCPLHTMDPQVTDRCARLADTRSGLYETQTLYPPRGAQCAHGGLPLPPEPVSQLVMKQRIALRRNLQGVFADEARESTRKSSSSEVSTLVSNRGLYQRTLPLVRSFVTSFLCDRSVTADASAAFCLTRSWFLWLPVPPTIASLCHRAEVVPCIESEREEGIPPNLPLRGMHDGGWRALVMRHVLRRFFAVARCNGSACPCAACGGPPSVKSASEATGPVQLMTLRMLEGALEHHVRRRHDEELARRRCALEAQRSIAQQQQRSPSQPGIVTNSAGSLLGAHLCDALSQVASLDADASWVPPAHVPTTVGRGGRLLSANVSVSGDDARSDSASRGDLAEVEDDCPVESVVTHALQAIRDCFVAEDRDGDRCWTVFEFLRAVLRASEQQLSYDLFGHGSGGVARAADQQSTDERQTEGLSVAAKAKLHTVEFLALQLHWLPADRWNAAQKHKASMTLLTALESMHRFLTSDCDAFGYVITK